MGTPPSDKSPDPDTGSGAARAGERATPSAIERIDEALRGLRYGSVLAIVQDGVVVQIERPEKTRFSGQDRR